MVVAAGSARRASRAAMAGAVRPARIVRYQLRQALQYGSRAAGMTMARAAATTSKPSTPQLSQAAQPRSNHLLRDRPAAFRLPPQVLAKAFRRRQPPGNFRRQPRLLHLDQRQVAGELVLPVVEITKIVLTRDRYGRRDEHAQQDRRAMAHLRQRMRPTLAAPRPVPTRIGNSSRGAK